MIDYTKSFSTAQHQTFDEGLRAYILRIYNLMAAAIFLTGAMAYASINFPPLANLMYEITPNGQLMGLTGFGTLMTFAPLAIAMFFFMGMGSMSLQTAQTTFWVYAAVMGMSLSYLGLAYTGQSLAKTFFISSSVFGAMSIYGYTTKKDLTSIGSFLTMGLIGLIIVSLVNIFLRSPAIDFATSLIGVAIFMGITAWDTQRLKAMYYQTGGGELGQKMAIVGAFTLYLDFINLYLYLIRFFGERK